jgi:hypothetical protein
MTRAADRPFPFLQTLPESMRSALWLPWQCVTLSLPAYDGTYTAFTVHRSPRYALDAYNVAICGRRKP